MIYYTNLQSALKTFLLISILKCDKKFFQSPPVFSNIAAEENWFLKTLMVGKHHNIFLYITKYKVFQGDSRIIYYPNKNYTKILISSKTFKKQNIIGSDDKLLSPTWYDCIDVYEKIYKITENRRQNYMKKDGTLLSPNEWFLECRYSINSNHNWLVVKRKEGEENYINSSSGKFLSQTNFLKCIPFHEGFGRVKLQNKKWNFINLEGNLLFQDISYENNHPLNEGWFDRCDDFNEGFARIFFDQLGVRFVKYTGEFLDTPYFEDAGDFHEGLAKVKLEGKGWNFIKKDGSILLPGKEFSWCRSFVNGLAEVCEKNICYHIDHEGKKLYNIFTPQFTSKSIYSLFYNNI